MHDNDITYDFELTFQHIRNICLVTQHQRSSTFCSPGSRSALHSRYRHGLKKLASLLLAIGSMQTPPSSTRTTKDGLIGRASIAAVEQRSGTTLNMGLYLKRNIDMIGKFQKQNKGIHLFFSYGYALCWHHQVETLRQPHYHLCHHERKSLRHFHQAREQRRNRYNCNVAALTARSEAPETNIGQRTYKLSQSSCPSLRTSRFVCSCI